MTTPFHLSFSVSDLADTRGFYSGAGCKEGKSTDLTTFRTLLLVTLQTTSIPSEATPAGAPHRPTVLPPTLIPGAEANKSAVPSA